MSRLRIVVGLGGFVWVLGIVYGIYRPLPTGVNLEGRLYRVPEEAVTVLTDQTYLNAAGQRHSNQQIFDEIFAMIDRAEHYVLLDMFLFNDYQGDPPETTRRLSSELTAKLTTKKKQVPGMAITVATDDANTAYGGSESANLNLLREAGIRVVMSELSSLRDSNPLYSSLYRTYLQWWGNSTTGSLVPHPFDTSEPNVTVRSYFRLLNFKANHRKLIVADEPTPAGRKMVSLVTSANPHDGSSAHGNIAVKVTDGVWRDLIRSEEATAALAQAHLPAPPGEVIDRKGPVTVQMLNEGRIRQRLLQLLNATQAGDHIDMAMFYLSDRSVIRALIRASQRGVAVRLLLDPNKDAFGHHKNGVPNRPVAHELIKKSDGKIQVRWCDTHGEQCHSKMVLVSHGEQQHLLAGSANLTRRNIGNYNLETNLLVSGASDTPAIATAQAYLNTLWSNEGGKRFSVDYEAYDDPRTRMWALYLLQEKTGLSSF